MDVNAATTEGITPVICAIFKGDNFVVQYLVDHGARLDVKDNAGRSVHHVGARHRRERRSTAAAAARDREARARAHGEAGHHDRDGELARRSDRPATKKAITRVMAFCFCAICALLLLQVELDFDGDVLRHPARVVPAFADVEVETVDVHRAGELRRRARARQRELHRDRLRLALQRELAVGDVRAVGGSSRSSATRTSPAETPWR